MVITHHPLLFHPLRNLDVDSPIGKTVERAITARIAIYSAHTNLDSAPKGVNAVLANRLGLIDSVVLSPALGVDSASDLKGLGRIGYLREKQTLHQLATSVKSALSLQMVKVVGNRSVPVRQVALCSGSGGSLLDAFFKSEAQVFISGDLSYHDARNVEDHGRMMIDIGHFGSERWIIDAVANQLREIMGQFNWPTVIEACELEKDPFIYV
jgi:dinuclear metal center YbgI/SA1388 family protein